MNKLENIQQKLIDDYGNTVQSFIEQNRLHINYKGKGYNHTVSLCFNKNLRICINDFMIDFKNVTSVYDYLTTNVLI